MAGWHVRTDPQATARVEGARPGREKPGNLLPNDLGDIGRLKPLIDRLAAVKPEFLARISTIIEKIVLLTEEVTHDAKTAPPKTKPATKRKG